MKIENGNRLWEEGDKAFFVGFNLDKANGDPFRIEERTVSKIGNHGEVHFDNTTYTTGVVLSEYIHIFPTKEEAEIYIAETKNNNK